jgi:hypothetical protein
MFGLLLPDGRFMILIKYDIHGVCLRIMMICQASPRRLYLYRHTGGSSRGYWFWMGKTGRHGITGIALLCRVEGNEWCFGQGALKVHLYNVFDGFCY